VLRDLVVLHRSGEYGLLLALARNVPQAHAALIDGRQIALFRTYGGEVYALSNRDPFSGAYVLSRGIVGTRGEIPTVASPMHKEVFDLRTGACLDDPEVSVEAFATRVRDGRINVSISAEVAVFSEPTQSSAPAVVAP
jgi:nitrite reductase (NADH) small subunit